MITACTARGKPDGSSSEPRLGTREQAGADAVVATLERAACFGICPVYTVSVRADRMVQYEGKSFVKVKGRAEKQLTEASATRLRQAFDKANFASLRDAYVEHNVTDLPTVIVSRAENGVRKTVRHYHGDRQAPREFDWLEREIDSIDQCSANCA